MDNTKEKIRQYMERAENTGKIPIYGLHEQGKWDVLGGTFEKIVALGFSSYDDKHPKRPIIGIVEGRYIDAIVWAVEQNKFYGDWVTNIDHSTNGYVMKHKTRSTIQLESDSELEGLILNDKINKEENKMKNKTIAWNVDTQLDFMSPLGKLYVEGAETIEDNLRKLTQYFRDKNMTIVNTADYHNPDSEELSNEPDFMNTFPEHCMKNSPGAEYIDATKPNNPYKVDWEKDSFDKELLQDAKEIVIYKDAFDVFAGNKHTDSIIDLLNPESVIVYGVATNVCVDFAVIGLLERNKDVYVIEDAIKALPNIESPIEKWKEYGAKLVMTEDVVYRGE
jgi:nicotinamidase/pyrazinamidase